MNNLQIAVDKTEMTTIKLKFETQTYHMQAHTHARTHTHTHTHMWSQTLLLYKATGNKPKRSTNRFCKYAQYAVTFNNGYTSGKFPASGCFTGKTKSKQLQ